MKKDKKTTIQDPAITELMQKEDVQRENEEKFRIIFSSIADGISVIDLSTGKIIDVNAAAMRMFNSEREDIIGTDAFELVAEKDRRRAMEDSTNIIQTGDSSLQEWRLVGKGGCEHECEARASIVYDSGGRPKYMVNVMRDITKRKLIERKLNDNRENLEKIVDERTSAHANAIAELRESEEWHRALVETSGRAGIGIVIIQSMHGREAALVFVNDKACEIAGYSREELLNMTLWDLMPPDILEQIMLKYRERQRGTPVPHSYETAVVRKDKVRIPIMVSVALMQLHGKPATAVFFRDITVQKQAEEALRASEERFKALTEYSNDTIMRFDPNHRHLYVNPIVESQTGIKPKDFIGKTHRELGFPEHLVRIWEEAIDRVFTIAKPYNVEFQLPAGIWIDWLLMPEFSDSGRVSAVITSARDITERKRAEKALRESEEKLRALFQTVGVGVTVTDIVGNIIDVNDALLELYGFSGKEEIIGRNGFEFISRKDYDRAIQGFNDILTQGTGIPMDLALLRKDGSEYLCETTTTLMKDASGDPAGLIIVQRDITERKRAEETLRKNEGILRSLLDATPAGVGLLINRVMIKVNNALCNITGYTREELEGSNVRMLYPNEEEYLRVGNDLYAQMKAQGIGVLEATLKHKNGDAVYVSLCLSPFDPNDRMAGVTATVLDITERKKAENALRESEEKYREVVERANDGIIILQDGIIQLANSRMAELGGTSVDQILGTSITDHIYPSEFDKVLDLYKRRMAGEKLPSTYDTILKRRDGSPALAELNAGIITYKGKPADLVIVRDTTERKKAEAELKTSEERFRSLIEKSSDVVIVIGRDSTISYTSPSFRTVFKRDPSELFGKSALDFATEFVHQNDIKTVMKGFEDCLKMPNKEIPAEFRFRLLDGSWLNLEVIGKNHLDNPSIQGLVVNIRNITERKKAEDALRASEEKYRGIFDESIATVYIFDNEKRFIDTNQAGTDLLGYSREELLRMSIPDVDADPDVVLPVHANLLNGGRLVNYEHRLRRKDGNIVTVLNNSRPLTDSSGNVVGMLSTLIDITERERAEEALHEAEQKYRALVENASDVIFSLDVNGTITYISPFIEKLSGFTPDEITGTSFGKYIMPDDLAGLLDSMNRTLSGSHEPYEFRVLCKDGGVRYAVSSSSLLKRNGQMIGLTGVITDITERRWAEEALREAEQKYRALVENASEVIFSVDIQGTITYISPFMEKLSGFTPHEVIGTNFSKYVVPDDLPGLFDSMTRTLSGSQEPYEFRVFCKDGSIRYAVSSSSLLLRDGQPIGLTGVISDITERKRAEEALRTEQKLFSTITTSAQDAIIMMDSNGNVSFWNLAAERIFGYSSREAIGRHMHTFLAPERYHPAYTSAFEHFRETGEGNAVGKTLELVAIRKDGVEIPIELSMSAIKQKGSWHAVGIARDITERKKTEESLKQMNAMMEKQTVLAKYLASQAELASAAKSEFLANMSHEIRTPLNGVIGMTGLLLDTELSEEQRRYAEIVRSSGKTLLGLINDILDFSKIEAGKFDLETLDFDLITLLDDFASTLALRAHDKGLELIFGTDPAVPTLLRGDPGRLRQILTNLAGNAIKFTSKGEVSLRVTVEDKIDNSVMLRFTVRDTGIGIAPDKIGLLFDKFTQADSTTTRRYGGTGLGLAISKQLVELMGGRINVASEVGKGSEFWFTARFERQPNADQVEIPIQAELQNTRVLIVDDNATAREMMSIRLNTWGMRPSEVEDGPAALKALYCALEENDPFRMAVIDMQMPGMNGETLGRAIQADPRLAETRMIILTSLGTRGDAKRFAEIGFAGYLTKPAQNRELKDILSLALAVRAGVEGDSHTIATRHLARESLSRFQGSRARILLAEDNITNQNVALGILKKLGLRADAVANGEEALKALESIPYDLVLMDCQMPVMDGYEATREIRNHKSPNINRQIPIIAMTAHALQGDREKCIESGMNDYLPKPVSPQAMAEVLGKWLLSDETKPAKGKTKASAQTAKIPLAGEPPVWDKKGMLERLMDDENLVSMIMDGFMTDIPRQIQALAEMLEAGDIQTVQRQAHTIKGASANVGGERLRAVAFEMEKAAKAGNTNAVKARMVDLNKEFEGLKQSVKEDIPNIERRAP